MNTCKQLYSPEDNTVVRVIVMKVVVSVLRFTHLTGEKKSELISLLACLLVRPHAQTACACAIASCDRMWEKGPLHIFSESLLITLISLKL